jgi:hypothetical protein
MVTNTPTYEGYAPITPEEMAGQLLKLERQIHTVLMTGCNDYTKLAEMMYFHHTEEAEIFGELLRGRP